MKMLLFVILFALCGCASQSKIVPYGKDTYLISVDDALGGYSPNGLQVKAAEKANAYCASMGKVIQVRNTNSQGNWGWTATSSSLIFSCIDESDSENRRPVLRNEPGTVIEDRRTP
jgi:hypothetical protein